MVKPKKSTLGRSLIKDRYSKNRHKRFVDGSMLHTAEINDGYDWGRLNLQSVTEESSLQQFLSTAELAGTEFKAEKMNIQFVNPKVGIGLLTKEETKKMRETHEKHKDLIKIPRRPKWTKDMSAEALTAAENEDFLKWRRSLAELQEDGESLLTPFEKNLEFWRQLWRVVERSDVVIQIVDARNPLLFRCEDLEKYVKEVNDDKMNMILINKSDFLTLEQREIWAKYFDKLNVQVVFFSAIAEEEEASKLDKIEESEDDTESEVDETVESEDETTKESGVDDDETIKKAVVDDKTKELLGVIETKEVVEPNTSEKTDDLEGLEKLIIAEGDGNSSKILSRIELIEFFRNIYKGKRYNNKYTTIGLVGYPNVGKSSTINSLLLAKKVSVSATPGKTKHFQTLYLTDDILLCDCPGLVMPSFVYTKAEMIVNGILPIDQLRDHVPSINLVANLIPRHVFEDKYGFMLPQPMDSEDPNRCPTSEELLNAHAYNRGFMTANGQPDNPRSARYILKDFVTGKLLYAHAPPDFDQEKFHTWPERQRVFSASRNVPLKEVRATKSLHAGQDLDKVFFTKMRGSIVKGRVLVSSGSQENASVLPTGKPWIAINKHKNKKKKEKARRLYSYLDEH